MRQAAAWEGRLLDELERSSRAGAAAARFVRESSIQLAAHDQPTGARWTLGWKIELHPRYVKGRIKGPYALSLVVHEVQHVKQGPLTALSVFGELEAWQVQFNYLMGLKGRKANVPGRTNLIDELLALQLGWDRSILSRARRLMREYAGNRYRIDLLPLYPLHHEILHAICRRAPRQLTEL